MLLVKALRVFCFIEVRENGEKMLGVKLAVKFLVLSVVVLGFFSFTYAVDVDLEKIVVTPYRYGESLAKIASDVTVITEKDIEGSNAQNVVDVFRALPGITVRDWYGNGVKAAVDIGGFGEQAALNVLVLVDGRRINDVDLSGVDWSQVPLDQVERIEIVRGGSGAVLYGDNASSGVINIITKKGSGKPKVNLEAEYGSYAMNRQKLSLSGSMDNRLSYWLSSSWDSTNGYRHNSFSKNNDYSSKFAYDFTDILSAHFDSGFHSATYGMPGSLSQGDIDRYSRRYARFGNDHANTKDYYFVFGPKIKLPGLGNFDIDFSYRQKDTDSYFLTSGNGTYRNSIGTFGVTPKYTLDNSILNHNNKFIIGLDFYRSLYSSKAYSISDDSTVNEYTNIHKNSLGTYLQDEFSISEKLILVGGYRHELADYSFAYHNALYPSYYPDQDTKVKYSMDAFNSGLTYTYKDDSNIYLNVSRSFRFPEVDEFTYYDPSSYQTLLNTGLKPQSSVNYQVGIRHKFSDRFKGSLSLFRMNVKNEIYFNATDTYDSYYYYWNSKNANYDRTVHEGLETSLNAQLNDRTTMFFNYTLTNAYFDNGQYSGNKIPMVPKNKGSVGLKFALPMNMNFNIIGTYVGPRYYLNDQANAYSKLNGYMIADTNLSWHYKDFKITFGINNLFDKQYSEYAGVVQGFSTSYAVGEKFYYPSPERNFSLKVDYSF